MVFINGGNFIDGLNTLLIKYFIIIYLILLIPLGTFLIDDLDFIKKFNSDINNIILSYFTWYYLYGGTLVHT